MTVGCCGSPRPVSLRGLLAEADAYPASSARGRHARARLAYTIVAGKAAQAGNRPAFQRALGELRALGTDPPLTTHGTVEQQTARAAQGRRITAIVTGVSSGPTLSEVAAAAPAVVTMLGALARAATGIASAAGGDRAAIAAANTVISWVLAIVNGTPPTIPVLDEATLAGFTRFCAVGTAVFAAVDTAFAIAITALGAAALRGDASAAQTATTLGAIQGRLDGLFTGLCAAVAEQVVPVDENARCASTTPNSIWDPTYTGGGGNGGCVCAPGFVARARAPGVPGADCVRAVAPPGGGGSPIMLTPAQRQAIMQARSGRMLTPAQQQLVRTIPLTLVPGNLDPNTLCAPGENPNPATGVCDAGGPYPPPGSGGGGGSGGGKAIPLVAAAVAAYFLLK